MPFVRIDLAKGKSPEHRKTIGEIVYTAMTETINVPADDKFQVITEHPPEELNYPKSYLGIEYSKDIVFIQITLNGGRTVDMKKAFYKRIADDLVEVAKENWSFGNGIAQYA